MRTSSAILTVLSLLALAPLSRSQSLTFNTLAGYAGPGSTNGTGAAARFATPGGIASDAAGDLFVADTANHVIRKITPAGVVTTLAGVAGVSGSADGTGSGALFNQPQGMILDSQTNIYVADTGNNTIRQITIDGVVTTFAGTAGVTGTNDANGAAASFNLPLAIAINSTGKVLYVADAWNHTIRKISIGGTVTTFAGIPGTAGSANGPAASATFYEPSGVAVDLAGNVYVADTGNHAIRMINISGVVSIIAGTSGSYGSTDGASALFWSPQGLAIDASSNLYVADYFNHTIRKYFSGTVSTVAGLAGYPGSADGTNAVARFWQPQALALDGVGNLFVADSANGTIRKVTNTIVTTVAGAASIGGVDGTGGSAKFNWPTGAALDSSGNTYLADAGNNTVRKISSAGVVGTPAGLAGNFGTTDATGSNARFSGPQGVAVDSSGNLYVADSGNHTIRKITTSSVVSTLAGAAGTNGLTDGTGTAARFNSPQDLAFDSSGNLFVADTANHCIRKVTSGGVVTTVAGRAGYPGNIDSSVAGNGTNVARFNYPSGVAVDPSGNIYVADTANHAIRKVTGAGVVSTLAGMPGVYGSADGTNNAALFFLPEKIAVDASGNLYVADTGNHTIRKLVPSGTNWVVTTVAGVADVAGSVDGANGSAQFFYPSGIAINNSGTFSLADLGNNTVRTGLAVLQAAPSISTQPQNQTANFAANATFSVVATGTAPLAYQWLFNGSSVGGATASAYTVLNVQSTSAGSYSVVVTNGLGTITSSNALLTVIIPPSITNAPQNLTINQAQTAAFSVGASGTAPLAYQWLYNGGTISSATASSYVHTNAQPGDSGSYSVIVSNAAGGLTSSPAILTVNPVPTPPGLNTQPLSQTNVQGTTTAFSVFATGSTPLAYQWRFQGSNLVGATASSYSIFSSQATNAGSYFVIVTNAYGAITSSVATLTLLFPPVISVQPASQLAAVSNNVTFSVGLSQGTSPTYQWRTNGVAIAGATQSSLTLASISWASAGSYSVVVSNNSGSVTSSNAVLTVEQAVFSFFDGFEAYQPGILENNITGTLNPTSPWWALSAGSIRGAVTNASTGVTPHSGSQMLGTPGTQRQDYLNLLYRLNAGQPYNGNFLCEWWFYDPSGTNAAGATNAQDYIALNYDAPVSTTSDSFSATTISQRMSLGTFNGAGYNYSNYQARIIGGVGGTFGSGNSWYNLTNILRTVGWHHARIIVGIPGAANVAPVNMYIDNMTNAAVSSSSDGGFGFNLIEINHAMVSTANTNWYYDDLNFRAANDPWIIEQPVSQTLNPGNTVTFTTVAIGTAYQWQFNGTNLSGATTNAYSIASVDLTNAGSYTCVITGTNGTLATTAAVLTVIGPPVIATQPVSLIVTQTQAAVFSVAVTGASPFNYQWQFGNSTIAGATASTLTVANSQSTNAGSYSVIITNAFGSVTSSIVSLTVNVGPFITTQPATLSLAAGTNATFSVAAGGTATLLYQWRLNGTNISSATATAYTRTNIHTVDVGSYSVIVSNAYGSVTSSNAVLIVNNPPVLSAMPNVTVHAGAKVTLTNTATDSDLPAQTLTFSLGAGAPVAATLGSSSGILTWLTADTDANTVNPISVHVVDNGVPALSATNNYTIIVAPKPTLNSTVSNNIITLNWTSIAGDTYDVQYKTNLFDASWSHLTNVTATNAAASTTDSTLNSIFRIYRILLVQ